MDAKAVLLKVIDEDGILSLVSEDILDGVVKAELDKLVAKTDNSLDDALVEMIYPIVKDAVMQFLSDKLAELKA